LQRIPKNKPLWYEPWGNKSKKLISVGPPTSFPKLSELDPALAKAMKKFLRPDMKIEPTVQSQKKIAAVTNEVSSDAPGLAPVDQDLVDELVLYTMNDGDIYRQRIQPIIKNMQRKMAKGIFDPELSVKAFAYAAQDGFKKYSKEFGRSIPRGSVGATMMAAGKELLNHYMDEIKPQQPLAQKKN